MDVRQILDISLPRYCVLPPGPAVHSPSFPRYGILFGELHNSHRLRGCVCGCVQDQHGCVCEQRHVSGRNMGDRGRTRALRRYRLAHAGGVLCHHINTAFSDLGCPAITITQFGVEDPSHVPGHSVGDVYAIRFSADVDFGVPLGSVSWLPEKSDNHRTNHHHDHFTGEASLVPLVIDTVLFRTLQGLPNTSRCPDSL